MAFRLCALIIPFLSALHAQQYLSVIDAVGKGHAAGREPVGVAAVLEVLETGGDVNERDQAGWPPPMCACLECRADVVRLPLDRGADVALHADGSKKTPFMDLRQRALTIGASCFIAGRGATVMPERGIPDSYLHKELAAPLEILWKWIRHGANVNRSDTNGSTPLMMALMHNGEAVGAALLAANGKVDFRDGEDRTVATRVQKDNRLSPAGGRGTFTAGVA